MTPVPLDLPLRPAEAAEVANLVFEQAERKPLTDEVRNRIAARAAVLRLESLRPWFGSLVRDPVHPSSYYLAVDTAREEQLLLHFAVAAAPTSSIFFKPLLIGRMRRANGQEMVLNAVPFRPNDFSRLDEFAVRLDTAFLPRPQGSRMTITAEGGDPAKAFEAFRAIWKRTGKNVAALSGGTDTYHYGLWAAIRAGWREGFTSGVRIRSGETLDAARQVIRGATPFTRFTVDTTCLLAAGGEDEFERCFTAEERGRIFDEFAGVLADAELIDLAVKWGRSLQAAAGLHEAIRQARGRPFDFELSLEGAPSPTNPQELSFCLRWLRARGHAAQLVSPQPGDTGRLMETLPELAQVCRQHQCTLSLRARPDHGPETLDRIARETAGRVNYAVPGESSETITSAAGQLLG